MPYQVLARKWRPQRFEDVIGQQAVTRTLKNALRTGRLAQAFVFAGPRGCGKTTCARILARALNCIDGPAAEPCGRCEPCVEIAEGRDIDVLEIDAATHTGVDNVREVIIEGLSIAPVRNRYRVFIVDEVHMLSASSFNALLKSIEEPPPHVVFMMATTELQKIPDTVLSRSQVHEFRTISSKVVVERLRQIAAAEGIRIPDEALLLLARAGEGSMRDSLSALDQVRAFAGDEIAAADVVAVLGLIGRDLVFEMIEAVVAEDVAAVFALTERAIERGCDLHQLSRELARALRDLLLLSVDRGRAADPEVVGEAERDRVLALVDRWSREDLLRGFDLLTRAGQEIRASDQPRFNMEMTLLRLMHLRRLVPLTELLLAQSGPAGRGAGLLSGSPVTPGRAQAARSAPPAPLLSAAAPGPAAPPRPAAASPRPAPAAAEPALAERPAVPGGAQAAVPGAGASYRDALLAEIKAGKPVFYNMVVAQALGIDARPDGVTFTFRPNQKVPRMQCEEHRAWVQDVVERLTGTRLPVRIETITEGEPAAATAPAAPAAAGPGPTGDRTQAALQHETVRHLLDVFPVERTTVQEE